MENSTVAKVMRKCGMLDGSEDPKEVAEAVTLFLSCGETNDDKLLGMFRNALGGLPGLLRMLRTVEDEATALGVLKNLEQLSHIILDLKVNKIDKDRIVSIMIAYNKRGGSVGKSSASGADSSNGGRQEPSSDRDKAPVHG